MKIKLLILLLSLLSTSYGLTLINHCSHTIVYDPQIDNQSLFLQKGRLLPYKTNPDIFSTLNYPIRPRLNLYLWFKNKAIDLPLANTIIIDDISTPNQCKITITGSQTNNMDMLQPTVSTEHCFD